MGRYVFWYIIKVLVLILRMMMLKVRESRVRVRWVVLRRWKRWVWWEGGEMVLVLKLEEEIWVLRWEVMMDGEWFIFFGVLKF